MENTNPTNTAAQTTQPPTPAQTQTPPVANPPATQPETKVTIPEGLTEEQKKAFETLSNAVEQAQKAAAAATAKADAPWYWNDFSKGVYVGAGVVLLAVGGVYLYKKYTGDEAAV